MDIAPWFTQPLMAIQQQFSQHKLPHASLLKLPYPVDVSPLITEICRILRNDPQLTLSDATDIYTLASDQGQIKLDAVKEVMQHLTLNSHSGQCKVVIIMPVEAMNIAATNAILKTLEEPMPDTYFFLVSYQSAFLLPTIHSRVQEIEISIDDQQMLAYLKSHYQMSDADVVKALTLTRHRIDKIIQIKTDKSQWQMRNEMIKALMGHIAINDFAEQYKLQVSDVLFWLSSLLCDVYMYQLGAQEGLANIDQISLINLLAQRHRPDAIYTLYQQTLKTIGLLGQHYNVNIALSIELLLLQTQQGIYQ